MQHFMIEITYTLPIEEIGEGNINEHRQFLQGGYARGMLLMSGPQEPPRGGIVIARAESLEQIQAFFENDPYRLRNLASYRFTAFRPVKHAAFLEEWVSGK